NGLVPHGELDRQTLRLLESTTSGPLFREYTITPQDVKGPFTRVPRSWTAQSKLPRLSYGSPAELLAEKFHTTEDVLRTLNPGASPTRPGETISVRARVRHYKAKVARIEVDKTNGELRAYDANNNLVATYPATVGSDRFPSPSGSMRVVSVT